MLLAPLQLCQPCHEPDDIWSLLFCSTLLETLKKLCVINSPHCFQCTEKALGLWFGTLPLADFRTHFHPNTEKRNTRNTRVHVIFYPEQFTIITNGTREHQFREVTKRLGTQGYLSPPHALLYPNQKRNTCTVRFRNVYKLANKSCLHKTLCPCFFYVCSLLCLTRFFLL